MLAVPGLLGAALMPSRAPEVRGMAEVARRRPDERGGEPPARWDAPANESLAMLRRVTASEARRSVSALAACEARDRPGGRG